MAGSQARGIPLFTAGLKLPSRPRTASALESEFALQLRAAGIQAWRREFRFDQYRRWCFDFAWPDQKVAVEIEGGTYTGGRHVRGKGYASDCEKYAEAHAETNRAMTDALLMMEEREQRDEDLLRQALEALELRCGTNAEERNELIPALRERLGVKE